MLLMRKWKILLLIFGLCISLIILFLHQVGLIYVLPIPKYQKAEPINLLDICQKKVKNSQSQKLCFDIIKNNDFKHGLTLLAQAWNYPLEGFPWYYYDSIYFYSRPSIKGVEKLIIEGANHDSAIWCREFSTFPDGTQVNEDYYLCRAFLENPYFCKKAPPNDKLRNKCYGDAAVIWQDPALCEKAFDPDFCYLRLAVGYIEAGK